MPRPPGVRLGRQVPREEEHRGNSHEAARDAWEGNESSPGRGRPTQPQASYHEVFAIGEFRALWLAQILSYVGDQFAQVAIAILVFERTGSAFLTALAYALTYLPPIVGGPLLSGLADLFPRRRIMIG